MTTSSHPRAGERKFAGSDGASAKGWKSLTLGAAGLRPSPEFVPEGRDHFVNGLGKGSQGFLRLHPGLSVRKRLENAAAVASCPLDDSLVNQK